ncbi:proton-translocating NADH-quinone oxidoreductase, chain M subfamily [marine gamma proteobacterium HTCC2148]|nr:proton-translocating NADH-quinone oxidoreductase, chain M subfamily [marine gamma proteobacterium HTCC2148]
MMLELIMLLLAGGVVAWQSERFNPNLPRWIAMATVILGMLLLLSTISGIPADTFNMVTEPSKAENWLLYSRHEWIPRFGISLELGMDGLSLLMLILTLALGAIAIVSSWNEIEFNPGLFQANLLWTLTGVIGVFLALDLFLFFLFWEVMLIPMYLLIAIWGHENRGYAAMKFFIFTQVSGLLMLLSIIVLAVQGAGDGDISFSYGDLLGSAPTGKAGMLTMLGFFLAFTVKLPGFPFHTWLPDAHTQAPTAGSVLLAGILLKTGAYGLLRFCIPLFPEASMQFAPIAMTLGTVGIIYGAVLAFAQSDFKRLVAYSSVSHMGFVLLGLYAWNSLALQGAIMQMVAHGVSTAALFMMAGALQHRLHTRDMNRMGGLWYNAPRMGACAMFFAVASLGLPGMGNFVAEFLVLAGLFAVSPWMTAAAAIGLITAAIYSLWLMQKTFQGKPDEERKLQDFDRREMGAMVIMMAALLWLGLYPQPVFDLTQPVLEGLQPLIVNVPETLAGNIPGGTP